MEFQKLQYEVKNHVAYIMMDFGGNLNAIDVDMADELLLALDTAEKNNDVHTMVLGSVGKAFSAGGDIRFFYEKIQSGGEVSLDPLIDRVGKLTRAMKSSTKMIVAAVNGVAAGAGVSLALSADFIVCSSEASFILAFVKLGLAPDTGATYLLAKAIGDKRTMELAATGRPLTASEAEEYGLLYKMVAPQEVQVEATKLAEHLAKGPLLSYKNIKKQIYAASFTDYEKFLTDSEATTQRECAVSNDFKEGVKAFIEKRKPEFKGN